MYIDGTTRVYAIVADPIEQVKTPQSINAAFRARGFNGVLVPAHVSPENLRIFFQGLKTIKNFDGLIVTVPHKQAAALLCDEISVAAQMTGAVNVVRKEESGRLVGDILDGKGFVDGLLLNDIRPADKKVFLAGAGGAASAIAFALAHSGVSALGLYNRTVSRARDLQSRLNKAFPDLHVAMAGSSPEGYDLIVNATSLGMNEADPLPFNADQLDESQIVAEVIMQPEVTALLQTAKQRGCRIQPGRPMLNAQIDLMISFMGAHGHKHG